MSAPFQNSFGFAHSQGTAINPIESQSYSNSNPQANPYIYLAVYSSVPVYEMMVRGIGVMRRRADSFLNATQILKVAGVEKGKRTKILDKDIASGVHEKVQGGYGRYQGTWIPFERAVELANQFNVFQLLSPLFDYNPPQTSAPLSTAPGPSNPIPHYAVGPPPPPIHSYNSNESLEASRKRSGSLLAANQIVNDDYKRVKVDSITALGNGSNGDFSTKLKRATKTTTPQQELNNGIPTEESVKLERHKTILKSIFAVDPSTSSSLNIPDLSATFPPDIDVDNSIDDHDHSALHWAAALARISVVQALINFGADLNRGNNVGETPLIRAVLVTNNSDNDSFMKILQILGPSLRTVDDTGRTVLHHAALVAGVKGRASSARYYMESVLEYVARHEKGQFRDLVDAQDSHGDTALNIAARIGNRGLVRMLIEVGADKVKPNKLGLRPGDFGVDGVDLTVPPIDDVLANIRSAPGPSAPAQKSSDAVAALSAMIASLDQDFHAELLVKTDALDRTRNQLRAATRELSEQRRQVSDWKVKAADVNARNLRIRNLERALLEEDSFDWTGRSEIDGAPSVPSAGPAFTYRGPGSTLSNLPLGIAIQFDTDPPLPGSDNEPNSLLHLMRLETWYSRVTELLAQRIQNLDQINHLQEGRLLKVVAGCCSVEPDKITDQFLEDLLSAVDSDGTSLDLGRVASFLGKVRGGVWI